MDGLVMLNVTPGELLDRISILEVKRARVRLDDQRRRAESALASARQAWAAAARSIATEGATVARLEQDLISLNGELWTAEDRIRQCERDGDWGPAFVAAARSICHLNDRRAELRVQVDALFDLPGDQKVYAGVSPE